MRPLPKLIVKKQLPPNKDFFCKYFAIFGNKTDDIITGTVAGGIQDYSFVV